MAQRAVAVRLSERNHARLVDMSYKTNQSMAYIIDKCVDYAFDRIKTRPAEPILLEVYFEPTDEPQDGGGTP